MRAPPLGAKGGTQNKGNLHLLETRNCHPAVLAYTAIVRRYRMKTFPITEWLPRYPRTNLRGDVIAGIALAGLLIPESMGYAGIAGLPPQAGLYATAFGLLAYAVFGSSRQLAVSPTSSSAVILAATVAPLAAANPAKFFVLASAVTLVLALLFLVAGILKVGFVSDFISKPVLKGFVFGIALAIVIKQLPNLLGIEKGPGQAYTQLWHTFTHIAHTNLWTCATGAAALAILFLVDKHFPRIPGALLVLVAGIAVSRVLELHAHGVDIVGVIPTGLPRPSFPVLTWTDWLQVAPAAVGLAFVLFAESLGAAHLCRQKRIRHRSQPGASRLGRRQRRFRHFSRHAGRRRHIRHRCQRQQWSQI